MNRGHQRGVLLLSVSIILAIIGALAFAMNREGAMSAQAVEAQTDIEVARYLAEAGLSLAKWRNENSGCNTYANLPETSLPGIGKFSATVAKGASKTLNIVATGTSSRDARFQITRSDVIVRDLDHPTNFSLEAGGGTRDTYLNSDDPTGSMGNSSYLELTQGGSNALIIFNLLSIPAGSKVIKADLKLYQYQSNSTQPAQVVSVHRVLRDWDSSSANWTRAKSLIPWSSVGGDYGGGNIAVATINGNGSYTWKVVALLDGWVNNTIPNYGLLLKPDGPLQRARFASLENTTYNRPRIDGTYLRPCS